MEDPRMFPIIQSNCKQFMTHFLSYYSFPKHLHPPGTGCLNPRPETCTKPRIAAPIFAEGGSSWIRQIFPWTHSPLRVKSEGCGEVAAALSPYVLVKHLADELQNFCTSLYGLLQGYRSECSKQHLRPQSFDAQSPYPKEPQQLEVEFSHRLYRIVV